MLTPSGVCLKQFKIILKVGIATKVKDQVRIVSLITETTDFQELSAKYGLAPQIIIDCFKAFASHINVPKGNGDVYHEPFKDTCIESNIVVDDCNKHAQTSESPISYKHVNFCGVHRPCE
jgi:hypothetical protein